MHHSAFSLCSLSLAKTQAEPTSSGSTVLSTEKDDREARALRSQIKLNEAFNGITFKSTKWEVVHKGTEWEVVHNGTEELGHCLHTYTHVRMVCIKRDCTNANVGRI